MKILALGDLHGRPYDRYFKYKNIDKYDKIVYLGDYVDSFYKSDQDIIENLTKLFLFKRNNMEKVELLLGNHDFQYLKEFKYRQCSGYRSSYSATITELLDLNKDCLKIAYQYENILFTHAGLTKTFFNKLKSEMSDKVNFKQSKNNNYANILNNCYKANPNVFWKISWLRGGYDESGSCLWADLREFLHLNEDNSYSIDKLNENNIIKDLSCICGHQPVKKVVTITNNGNYYVWCDTDSYETEENGKWIRLSEEDANVSIEL